MVFLVYIFLIVTIKYYDALNFSLFLGFLVLMVILSKIPLMFFLKRIAFISIISVVIAGFLPFFRHGNGDTVLFVLCCDIKVYREGIRILYNVLIRANLAIVAIVLLTGTTGFSGIVEGFASFGVPSVITVTIGMAYRYIYVLGEEAALLMRSARSRGYNGKWVWDAKIVGNLIGNLFLRAYERSERVYGAMVARGFSIEGMKGFKKRMSYKRYDYLFLFLSVSYLALVRVF